MYLRHTTRWKDGKVHTYWQLVRSIRVGRRVVQQTVAHHPPRNRGNSNMPCVKSKDSICDTITFHAGFRFKSQGCFA